MQENIKKRVLRIAHQCIETGGTIRQLASSNLISKSTVHKDLTERLPMLDNALYEEVKIVIGTNKSQRAIRGGMATKQKFKEIREWKAKKEG